MKNPALKLLPGAFLVFSVLHIADAAAQQAAPNDTPPRLEQVDESNEPGVTIRQSESQTTITEKRTAGEVRDIKVKSGKSTYHIRPGQIGTAMRGDAQSTQTHPPQWVVNEFGPGSKPATQTTPPASLPPAQAEEKK